MKESLLVVLSGPAGVGKTTIAQELLKRNNDYERSVSVTTRKKRPDEVDGCEYSFVSEEQFIFMKNDGELIESAEVHGKYYGTPIRPLYKSQNKIILLVIDVNGGRQVAAKDSNSLLLFIAPPDLETLEKRLKSRASENTKQQTTRLSRAEMEIEKAKEYYDYIIINDDLQTCIKEVTAKIEERRRN